jgi:hypothetical protein
MKQQNKALGTLLASVDSAIQSAHGADLPDTVALLRLARLDLLLRANGVASEDITLAPYAVARQAEKVKPLRPRGKKAETHSSY